MSKKLPPIAQREILKFELRALRAEKKTANLQAENRGLTAELHRLNHEPVLTPGSLEALAQMRRDVTIARMQEQATPQ